MAKLINSSDVAKRSQVHFSTCIIVSLPCNLSLRWERPLCYEIFYPKLWRRWIRKCIVRSVEPLKSLLSAISYIIAWREWAFQEDENFKKESAFNRFGRRSYSFLMPGKTIGIWHILDKRYKLQFRFHEKIYGFSLSIKTMFLELNIRCAQNVWVRSFVRQHADSMRSKKVQFTFSCPDLVGGTWMIYSPFMPIHERKCWA